MNETKITIREKVVIILVIFLIRLMKPWQYDHQFDSFWNELKNAINGADLKIPEKKP